MAEAEDVTLDTTAYAMVFQAGRSRLSRSHNGAFRSVVALTHFVVGLAAEETKEERRAIYGRRFLDRRPSTSAPRKSTTNREAHVGHRREREKNGAAATQPHWRRESFVAGRGE